MEPKIRENLWNVVKNNSADEVKSLLQNASTFDRMFMLNTFSSQKGTQSGNNKKQSSAFFLLKRNKIAPWNDPLDSLLFQAVVFASFKVLKVLLQNNVNLYQRVPGSNWNIIHYLIVISKYDEVFEEKAVKIYTTLQKILSPFEIRNLLLMEDKEGLRPLELSVHASCLLIFDAIINTQDVYLVKKERISFREICWYDVTQYERHQCCGTGKERSSVSPLFFLTYLDQRVLKSEKALNVLRNGMLKEWAKVKFKTNLFVLSLKS